MYTQRLQTFAYVLFKQDQMGYKLTVRTIKFTEHDLTISMLQKDHYLNGLVLLK